MKTEYQGIDYGRGQTNIDRETGIRYGVISQYELGESWYESSEPDYGPPTCGHCGSELKEFGKDDDGNLIIPDEMEDWETKGLSNDYYCEYCKRIFDSEFAFPEYPRGFIFESDGYAATQDGDDTHICILKSPYFTYCQFCSPCAPGAGYVMNQMDPGMGVKTYCFGHDWFEDNRAPYRVFRVDGGEEVLAE